jgi:hypothetical protein
MGSGESGQFPTSVTRGRLLCTFGDSGELKQNCLGQGEDGNRENPCESMRETSSLLVLNWAIIWRSPKVRKSLNLGSYALLILLAKSFEHWYEASASRRFRV